jgi:toxin ParE1/3/4
MSGYALHPDAFTDLDEIREYIARDNPDAADRVLEEIFDAIRELVPFPYQGHFRPDLRHAPRAPRNAYRDLLSISDLAIMRSLRARD